MYTIKYINFKSIRTIKWIILISFEMEIISFRLISQPCPYDLLF
jgi:hypothetical protein